jgi:hypothetical protein
VEECFQILSLEGLHGQCDQESLGATRFTRQSETWEDLYFLSLCQTSSSERIMTNACLIGTINRLVAAR